ncbi:MAG: RNA polymerase sigma factor [Bacillota bacterium]|nr:RNA polymerase sigma factor [Bacillota bacterium]
MVSNGPSLEELLCRHTQDVYRYLWLTCGDRDLAQDMTQETFCRAFASRDGFAGKSTVKTWLFAIARNVFLSTARRRARQVHGGSGRAGSLEHAHDFSGPQTPEEALASAEERVLLRKALAVLSERHRTLLVLREYWELPYNQIAEVMGISIGSVKKNLHLARMELRRAYREHEESGGCADAIRDGN